MQDMVEVEMFGMGWICNYSAFLQYIWGKILSPSICTNFMSCSCPVDYYLNECGIDWRNEGILGPGKEHVYMCNVFVLQEIMSKGDKDDNLEMDMAEFVQYMQNHERQLKIAFRDLDKNKDGMYYHY